MIFYKELVQWYLHNNRVLPWRETKEAYLVWLSEIMLQQTKVAQGLPYYMKFVKAFPTVHDLASASETQVLKLWQGLGYYSRARNLHFTAKYVANSLQGKFPDNYKELLQLKGVGDYTASAIASICFNEPVAVVDGNVYRVLSRYFGIHTPINSTKGVKEFKILAQSIMDEKNPGDYNQAIMDFGALHCKPKNPLCGTCTFALDCVAHISQTVNQLPVKEKKTKVKKRYFNFLVVKTDSDKTIMEERKGKGIWQGLYQFPLIETNKYINAEELLEHEGFNSRFTRDTLVKLFNKKEIIHKLSHQHLYTQYWIVETSDCKEAITEWQHVQEKPVPVLIENFLNDYLKEDA